jgi:hypothetical protein
MRMCALGLEVKIEVRTRLPGPPQKEAQERPLIEKHDASKTHHLCNV